MLGYFGYECFYCGKEFLSLKNDFTLDHIFPRSQGGTNCIVNRLTACTKCNCHERRDEDFESFLKRKCDTDEEFRRKSSLVAFWIMTEFHQHRQIPEHLLELVSGKIQEIQALVDDSVAEIKSEMKASGYPELTAKDYQRLSGIAKPPKGIRERGNNRRR